MSGQLLTNQRQEKGRNLFGSGSATRGCSIFYQPTDSILDYLPLQAGMFADLRLAPKAAIARRPSPSNIAVLASGARTVSIT